jgi:replicative DNA helicase
MVIMEQIGTTHEEQIIGAALAESGHWLTYASKLHPDLFVTYPVLGRELLLMTDDGHPTDPKSVQTWMADRGHEVKISRLLRLADCAPFSSHAMGVAVGSLHERAKRNALQKLSGLLAQGLKEPGLKADDVIGKAFRYLTDLAERSSTDVFQIASVLNDVVRNLGKPQQRGVKTGIAPIDSITHGFKPGELVVLGARPSMGKTALALGISARAAVDGGSVLLFSLEMSTQQLCQRLLSMLSGVNLARIVTGRVGSSDVTEITEAANVAHKLRLFVCEDTDYIEATCRQVKHRHGLDLVVIDYLQLMSCRAESREQQIATLSRSLKQLARRLGCPVLVLSQLNRAVEARTCKRPQLSDLRESGAIEQDADQVMLLWRPAYYDDAEDPTEAELILAKNRNGPTGSVELTWVEQCARFSGKKTA